VSVSEVVAFEQEYRLHIVDGIVRTGSQYSERRRLSLRPVSAGALAFGVICSPRWGIRLFAADQRPDAMPLVE
jgi:hypothetical protein